MNHSQSLKRDPEVAAMLQRGVVRRAEAGTLPTRYCRMCGQLLTDPASVHRGTGPDCAAREAAQAEEKQRFPVGSMVMITRGSDEGRLGEVISYAPIRRRRRTTRPFSVRFASAWNTGYFAADSLELVTGGDA